MQKGRRNRRQEMLEVMRAFANYDCANASTCNSLGRA